MGQRFKTVRVWLVIASLTLAVGCGSRPDLQVLSLECGESLGSHRRSATGEVRNVSFHPLYSVTAIVTFRSGNDAVVERRKTSLHTPLGPGETSRFETVPRGSAGVSTCEVFFIDRGGWVIPHRGTES
jgi:hypothetical protein